MSTLSFKKTIPHIGKTQKKMLLKKESPVEIVYAEYDEIKPVLSGYKIPSNKSDVFLLIKIPKKTTLKEELQALGYKARPKSKKITRKPNTPVPPAKQKKTLLELQDLLAITQEELAQIIGCSPRKLWSILNEKGEHFKQRAQAKSFNDLVTLIHLLKSLFSGKELKVWFGTPQSYFKKSKPRDLLLQGKIDQLHRWTYMQLEGSYP